ncbi:phosphatase PAP2 family protein [Lacticaseibacillus sharpeae]|uniref:Phosphatidic acid phosphatase type 2/haloperoxidase domain-containing protein n=1 Tax=Lacticaseibacillus sharpeae JCM 1186 = DSM 20505 TaxID=1291052 RepID=A0A0R1ZP32_9LACO|nr:phosphatase PAP2 family protein [Lacticaseibacillus sharpeae]KRM56130.1 hypothetical protein FC18_GL000660 [Lacticaseibacillus sharpeae JCM 1186 = DSM 20505]
MYRGKRQPAYLLIGACITATLFAILIAGVLNNFGYIHAIDQAGFRGALAVRNPGLTALVVPLTNFGNPLVVTILSIILALIFAMRRQWTLFSFVAVNMMGINAVNYIVKNIVERVRPFNADATVHNLVAASGWSFPSGHSTGAVLLYGTIIVCAAALVQKRWQVNWLRGLSIFLLITIPLSRIYVQVHYPTDVLAGLCLGATGLFLSLYFFDTENA